MSKKKVIVIEHVAHCPHRRYCDDFAYCSKIQKDGFLIAKCYIDIPDSNFPSWCPLEDVKE